MIRTLALLLALAVPTACVDSDNGSHSPPRIGCEDGCLDYAGTYASIVELVANDGEPTLQEREILVQQNGPAVLLANILGVADSEGMSFGHEWDGIDFWTDEVIHVEYSGASRPGEPYVIDLRIVQTYPHLNDGWDLTYEYVITLGEPVVYE